ncbi:hypothetical protein P154DRAFT_532924 [Amniculicola lignicola CBS 123094]|uniref:HTH psq-type domain-containing protein n=1 Tax=Amniculicola lignicola CBS 123094 TaxID=1392246 RepID=A0A6A5WPA1_9PLEO|nr:hypothetical protein P154DRAFT_532924 [Amniculicola lignicola CBS 123094]
MSFPRKVLLLCVFSQCTTKRLTSLSRVVPGSTAIRAQRTSPATRFFQSISTTTMSALQYRAEEERIQQALRYISTKSDVKYSEIAQLYRVNYQRLLRRVHGTSSQSSCPPTNQRLDPAQLAALELYIKRLNDITPPGTVLLPLRCDFFKRYITANSNKIWKIKQKSKDIERVASQERDIIKDFFLKYREAMEELGIQRSDVWNFNETGFQIGCGGSQYVVIIDIEKTAAESPSEQD